MTEFYCKRCAEDWSGEYDFDHVCEDCGARLHARRSLTFDEMLKNPGEVEPHQREALLNYVKRLEREIHETDEA